MLNCFLVNARPLSYWYTWEVAKHNRSAQEAHEPTAAYESSFSIMEHAGNARKLPGWICVALWAMLWPDLNWFIVNKYQKSYFADENILKEVSSLISVLLLLFVFFFKRVILPTCTSSNRAKTCKKKKDRLKSTLLVDAQVRRQLPSLTTNVKLKAAQLSQRGPVVSPTTLQ